MKDENFIEYMGDYLSVIVTGFDSVPRSLELWKQIVAACDKYDCYNILGQSKTAGELSTMDAFKHIEIFQQAGITAKHRIAWVAEENTKYEQLQFIETVLRNRALINGHLFCSREEAREWLLSPEQEDAKASKSQNSSAT